jgi:hypothetical protein
VKAGYLSCFPPWACKPREPSSKAAPWTLHLVI